MTLSENVVVFGADGQLGREVIKYFPEAIKTNHRNSSPEYLPLDDYHALTEFLFKHKPGLIINCAAYTAVDGCETDKRMAMAVNGDALKYMANSARKFGSYLVHVSTDYVFDGTEGNYNEDSLPNPINYYGLSKLVGDTYARSYENSLIIRTSGVYGHKGNFPSFIIERLGKNRNANVMKGYYSPIHAENLAHAMSSLIGKGTKGIANVSGERISRLDFARKIAEKFSLDRDLIVPVEKIENMVASRPFDSSLDTSLSRKILDFDFFSTASNLEKLSTSLAQKP